MSDKKYKEIFSKNLKTLLVKKNISQKELAQELNLSPSTVSMWLSKKSLPRMDVVKKIATIFDVGISDLIDQHDLKITTNDMINLIAGSGSLTIQDPREKLLIEKFNTLNDKGKDKAVEQVDMITRIFEYKKQFESVLNAAHQRTDTDIPSDTDTSDDNIMNDDSEWQ